MTRKVVLLIVVVLIVTATKARAHHSFAAVFDANKPVSVKGVITEIRLENPHSWFYIDVKDENGKVAKWSFEGIAPTSLIRGGYKKDAVKVGDVVTIKGSHAQDPAVNVGAAREIVLEDGRSFIVGPKGNEASGY